MYWASIGCVLLTLIVSSSASGGRTSNDITESVSRPTQASGDGRDPDDGWKTFVVKYGKKYSSHTEESHRRANRKRKLAFINAHNEEAASGKHGFTMKENDRIDWTDGEFRQLRGFRSQKILINGIRARLQTNNILSTHYRTVDLCSLPSCVDWTKIGWVGPVKNQGQCGSCWSYSATGSLQSQFYGYSGQMVLMSQQNLIDCSTTQGNQGCDGGDMQRAFWYVRLNGIESQDDYPDVSAVTGLSNQSCAFNKSLSVTSIIGWHIVNSGSESALQEVVALIGPVSAAMDASSIYFQYYSGGVYNISTCGSSINSLDHAVLVVGYGVYNGQPYWLIQNSWGTRWGINGYMMLARNANNMCGIATEATFPVFSRYFTTAPNISTDASCSTTSTTASCVSTTTTTTTRFGFSTTLKTLSGSSTANSVAVLAADTLLPMLFGAIIRQFEVVRTSQQSEQ